MREPPDGLLSLRRDQRRRHEAAGLILGIGQQTREVLGVPGGHSEQFGPFVRAEVAQRVNRLVGLHRRDQRRGALRIDLAQQRPQFVGLHLLQRIGGLLGIKRRQQLLPCRATEILEQISQFAGTQPRQTFVPRPQPHRGRGGHQLGAERLHSIPVDHAIRRRAPLHTLGAQTPQQRLNAQRRPPPAGHAHRAREEQVSRANHLHPIDVDQLMVQHVTRQQNLSRTPANSRKSTLAVASLTSRWSTVAIADASMNDRRRPTRTTRPVTGG